MTFNAHRIGDPNTAPANITSVIQSTIKTNDLLQSVNGSPIADHGDGVHDIATTSNGSNDVYAEDISCNLKGNADTCGHIRDTGSNNVFINAGGTAIIGLPIVDVSEPVTDVDVEPGTTELEAAISFADDPTDDGGEAIFPNIYPASDITRSISNGLNPDTPAPTPIDEDTTTITPVADIPSDCAIDIYSEVDNFMFPLSFQLSPNYTLGDLTTGPVLSHYPLRSQYGLTTNTIVCNLRLLCVNILEPMLILYPGIILTSGFRYQQSGSQHTKGQAVDVQIPGFTHQEFWDASKIVKQSLPYDQMILEIGKNYWWHLSYVPSGRHQVLTRTKPGTYVPNLIRII